MSDNSERQIGVIGKKDSVLPFRTLGMLVSPVESKEEANMALFSLVSKKVPLIFISEDIASQISETLNKYKDDPSVSIIPIPSNSENLGLGMALIKSNIEKAVGADLFLSTEE